MPELPKRSHPSSGSSISVPTGLASEGKALQEARLRLAAIVESSDDAIVSKTLDGVITTWNAGAQRIFGYSEAEAVGQPITILIPPELRHEEATILKTVRAGERIHHRETVRVTKSGQRLNVSLSISPMRDSSGRVIGISKIARDITERKRSEEALREMTRKLINAQEQERARIGRELHDDISQRLAMVAVELDQLQPASADLGLCLKSLRNRISDIADDLRTLSHDLHASKLDYLGAAAGMKSWYREFSGRHNVEVEFTSNVPDTIPREIGLCLFRVLQEALHNAAKHSGARKIEVRMAEQSGVVYLNIADLGRGFDLAVAKDGNGLGLTSMQERVRLVQGECIIESKPMGGTTIRVSVPSAAQVSRAATSN